MGRSEAFNQAIVELAPKRVLLTRAAYLTKVRERTEELAQPPIPAQRKVPSVDRAEQ